MRGGNARLVTFCAAWIGWATPCRGGEVEFLRADGNADASIDVSDAIHGLVSLFGGGPPPPCADAADSNDDGALDISDPVYTLGFLFLAGPPPAAPYPLPGCDETQDPLGCEGYGQGIPCSATDAIVVDHRHADLEGIPLDRVETAKRDFRVYYGHTSHGSQIVSGLAAMRDATYDYNRGASTLSIVEVGGDLGNPSTTAWADTTRAQLLRADNDRNVVMWSWCGQVSSSTEASIRTDYLGEMDALETEFPDVRFIYMTGHLDGTGATGNLHLRNEQIRAFCRDHGKILFDFADLESFDPDGIGYLEKGADDNCDWRDGGATRNWAAEWCELRPGECSSCSCAHSQSLNCDRKARAFWWMMARMAGRAAP